MQNKENRPIPPLLPTDLSVERIVGPFDVRDFDDTGVELPVRLATPESLIARVRRVADEYRNDDAPAISTPGQSDLFVYANSVSSNRLDDESCKNASRLWSIVTRAYADVRCDRSIDYVVADPEANLLFLQRCWELGAPASPFELNWILMNARKDGKLTDLPRAKRFTMPKARLDQLSFAADIAMRTVQERLYYVDQRDVSIDHVLCDPHLASEFDEYAKRIVPEQSSLDCRWAIMTLRKARRSCGPSCRLPRFDEYGLLEDLRMQNVPTSSGAYWVRGDSGSLFAGVATNLRSQIDHLVQRLGIGVVPDWVNGGGNTKPSILLCTADTYDAGERIRASVFKHAGSRLNFWNGAFFGTAA